LSQMAVHDPAEAQGKTKSKRTVELTE